MMTSPLPRALTLAELDELLRSGSDWDRALGGLQDWFARDPEALARAPSLGGVSALHWAALRWDEPMARGLLDAGAPMGARGSHGRAPLHWMALGDNSLRPFAYDDLEKRRRVARALGELLAPQMSALDEDGLCPLSLAILSPSGRGLALELLRLGADGITPRRGLGQIGAMQCLAQSLAGNDSLADFLQAARALPARWVAPKGDDPKLWRRFVFTGKSRAVMERRELEVLGAARPAPAGARSKAL